MSVITYTRNARCRDCKRLVCHYVGKQKRHFCTRFLYRRGKQDPVCNEYNPDTDWQISGEPDYMNEEKYKSLISKAQDE